MTAHIAGYEIDPGLTRGMVHVAPLCGRIGQIRPRWTRRIEPRKAQTTPFVFINVELDRLNDHELLHAPHPFQAAWCKHCAMLADEHEGRDELELLARVSRIEWAGRGGLALASFFAGTWGINDRGEFFGGVNILRRMAAWCIVVGLYPAQRSAETTKRLGGKPPFPSKERGSRAWCAAKTRIERLADDYWGEDDQRLAEAGEAVDF